MKPPRQPSTWRPTPCSQREVGRARRSGRSCRSRSCRPSRRSRRCCRRCASATQSTSTLRGHRVDRRVAHLDAEEVAALVERRVRGLGLDDVRLRDAARLRRVLAVGEHRVQDAAGAAGGDEADRLGVGDRVGVEEVERHGDDLALELRLARAHVALQRVHVGEQPERLVHEVVVLVVAAVHRAGALAGLPERVLLLGHRRAARRGPPRGAGPARGACG